MSRRAAASLAAVLTLGLAVTTGALVSGCGDDPVSERPASFAYIHATILQPSCATASCHSTLTATYGLRFDTARSAYVYLVDGDLVVPGEPHRSRLMHLLRGDETTRMPPDFPLPDADIELIERWILEGAKEN